jgi:hypothetical protein
MTTLIQRLVHRAAVLLAVLVLVPVASAGRNGVSSTAGLHGPPRAAVTTCHQYCGAARPSLSAPIIVRTEPSSSAENGFRWLDAAIGFGVACGAMLLGLGAFVIRRNARVVPAETAG